jgi:hypothetical protein
MTAGQVRTGGCLAGLYIDEKHAVQREYHDAAASAGITGHYGLRPPRMTTTLRVEANETQKINGPLADSREASAPSTWSRATTTSSCSS